nr:PREDICTED: zinc finger CCCH domain-containing protein 49-like [Daucus carota subsp. sativus]
MSLPAVFLSPIPLQINYFCLARIIHALKGYVTQSSSTFLYLANNPEVLKLLWTRGAERPPLEPPDDKSIRTLYVNKMDGRITELDPRDKFHAYGEIETLKMVSQACAFITYMRVQKKQLNNSQTS